MSHIPLPTTLLMPLWTTHGVADAVAAPPPPAGDQPVTGLSIDSRTLAAGELFIALKGPVHDGHDHVATALAAGAVAALVHRLPAGVDPARLILAADTQTALEALGRAARLRSAAIRLAITGSVGKTTVKEGLAHVLAAQGPTHAAVGSFNNHWGVPLTLARMPAATRFGVFELGMNHAGELAALSPQVAPQVALVTTIGPVHIEFFGTTERIARAKAEIFDGLMPGGTAIVPGEIPESPVLLAAAQASPAARVLQAGAGATMDLALLEHAPRADGTQALQLRILGQQVAAVTALPGAHGAYNAMLVLALAAVAGADLERAARDLAGFRPVKGRGVQTPVTLPGGRGTGLLIDESYNASPPSVRAALSVLATAPGRRRIAILGDMRELGEAGPALHAGLAQAVDGTAIDLVVTCGPLMAHLSAALPPAQRGPHLADSAAVADALAELLADGDTVMVKGSLGSAMKRVVDRLPPLASAAAVTAAADTVAGA